VCRNNQGRQHRGGDGQDRQSGGRERLAVLEAKRSEGYIPICKEMIVS
jgi:hypothetical protein